MKRVWLRAVILAAYLVMMAAAVSAQDAVRIYVSEGVMEDELASRLTVLLGRAFPKAGFELIDREDGSLRDLVIGDCAPQLAICAPGEAAVWAREGLMLPLQRQIEDQEKIAREILSVCVYDENLFMIPLVAHHRQMAVNVKLFEKHALGYMLDEIAHPVWYPTEFQQILEEFAIADMPAMDVWQAEPETSAAMEAMIQAIYCGMLLSEDGKMCIADEKNVYSGIRWMSDLIEGGAIGYVNTREAALERFLAGETAIFVDWTKELQKKYAQQMKDAGMMIKTRPYPSSSGLPVRSYELTGVSVFDSGDVRMNAMALQAAAFLHEDVQAQRLLSERGIFEDDSIWLWDLSASSHGATLRSLMCQAFEEIFEEKQEISAALERIGAGMDLVLRR